MSKINMSEADNSYAFLNNRMQFTLYWKQHTFEMFSPFLLS